MFQFAEISTHLNQPLRTASLSRPYIADYLAYRGAFRSALGADVSSESRMDSRWKKKEKEKMIKLRRCEGESGGVTDLDKQSANDM